MRNFDYYSPLKDHNSSTKIFYGILTPSDWNTKDEPTQFSLYTVEEEDILLGSPQLKKKYLKLLNHPVEIIGQEKTNEFGDQYIYVKKIKRLSPMQFELLSTREDETRDFEMQEFSSLVGVELQENNDYFQAARY